ncbi:hypothetical protein F4678DRAFT_322006 [Xylaria arbuscula]|nr:hypothetical protein F4678DRAFT_322006 [Xylaria arbuscula]
MGETSPLKLLSLDGGGIRGLASLYILRHLMQLVNHDNPPKPCDYFNLIGGTSTGGLIVIMLGRLQMGVDECIRKYLDVSSAAFQPKRSRANILARAKDLLRAEGAYQGHQLEIEFKKAALAFEGNEDAKFLCPSSPCKVFVCSFEKALNTPTLFRTYVSEATRKSMATGDCSIWEAARATSAAATFFDPVRIGHQSYVNGATGFNNPVEIVVDEARSIWPDALSRIQTIVSLGTGVPEPRAFGDDIKGVLLTLKMIATETEQTHLRFLKIHKDLGLKGRYFCFNVNKGLGDVRLDDHTKVEIIEAAARLYLGSPETHSEALAFVAVIPPEKNYIPLEARENILSWLPCSDQQHFYNTASDLRRNDETGNWFIGDYFEEWKKNDGSLFWLHAGAGSGKTVLTSKIIERIEREKDGLIAYYYFSFQHKEHHTLRDFKSALLVQLVKQLAHKIHSTDSNLCFMPAFFMHLRNKYHPSRSPKKEDLDMALKEIVKELSRAYIVIDALDECDNSQVQSDILLFVQRLFETSNTNLYILVASRPEVDIEAAIRRMPIKKRIVAFDTVKVDRDIRSHLTLLMKGLPYCKWSKSLQQHVVSYITQRSHGVFRWADMQIEALKSKRREVDVNRALRDLPKNLSETYKRILDRIEFENYSQEAVAVLRWLHRARTPLSLAQIAELAAFDAQATSTEDLSPASGSYNITFLPQNRFPEPLEIYRILSGLITLSGSFENRDPDQTIASFAHFSVREYLESSDAPAPFKLRVEDCNWFIFKSCLAYISAYDFPQPGSSSRSTYPLLLYSCLQLWDHAEVLYRHDTDEDEERATQFLNEIFEEATRKKGYAFGLALQRAGINLPDTSETVGMFIRSLFFVFNNRNLHTAVSISDLRLLQFLFDAGLKPTKNILVSAVKKRQDEDQVALDSESISKAEPSILRLRQAFTHWKSLTAETCPKPNSTLNKSEPHDFTSERKSIWDFLLKLPITDINATNSEMQTPLLLAALLGDQSFFCFLHALPNINHDHRDMHGWGPATCSLIGGNESIISLVFNRPGVDITSLDQFGWSPLSWARYRGLYALIAPFLPEPAGGSNHSISSDKFISFQEVKKYNCGSAEVWDTTFSHSGAYLAVSLSNGKCLILDVFLMSAPITLEGHEFGVRNASWSPNDTLITICCNDGLVRIFLAKNALLIKVIKFDVLPTSRVWLPNGKSFVLGSLKKSKGISLYSINKNYSEAEEEVRVDELDYSLPSCRLEDIALSPDGRYVVGMDIRQKLFVFLAGTMSLHYAIDIPRAISVAIDDESRQILLGLATGGHLLLDITNGATIHSVPPSTKGTGYILKSAFGGQDSSWILRPEEDGYISIWDRESSRLIGHVAGHNPSRTNSISWRPGNAYEFASGGDDGCVRIWSRVEPSTQVDAMGNGGGADLLDNAGENLFGI